jgi:hypothetical protein
MYATHEAAGAAWILNQRMPVSTEELALVFQKVQEIAGDLLPSTTLWERAYRILHKEGLVTLVDKPMELPPVRSRLTAAEYNVMSIHSIRQKYASDAEFKADVDELIKQGKVG